MHFLASLSQPTAFGSASLVSPPIKAAFELRNPPLVQANAPTQGQPMVQINQGEPEAANAKAS